MTPRLEGWLWNGERLVADDTPEGGLARGLLVLGGCRLRPECTRQVRLDLQELIYRGFARTPLPEVRRRYECRRRPRCEMSWIETYPAGVPLLAYVGDPGSWLEVSCEGCRAVQAFTFEQMIQALQASQRGDGNTGVRILAAQFTRPCKRCGRARWQVEVASEHAIGSGAPQPSRNPRKAVGQSDK